jgi:TonB family protein
MAQTHQQAKASPRPGRRARRQRRTRSRRWRWVALLVLLVLMVWYFSEQRDTRPAGAGVVAASAEAGAADLPRIPLLGTGKQRMPDAAPVPLDSNAQPRYPDGALRSRKGGTVLLSVEVGEDGVPTEIKVAKPSGNPELDQAATEAAQGWRFRPGTHNGKAISQEVHVPVEFEPM